MIVDTMENAQAYTTSGALREAFDFLRTLGPDTQDGEYEIRGREIFARVMRYETLPPEKGRMETHRRYADIQALLKGTETVRWSPLSELDSAPYDEEADVSFHPLSAATQGQVVLKPGMFAFFLPADGHMPMLACGGQPAPVVKVVIKVATGLLDSPPLKDV